MSAAVTGSGSTFSRRLDGAHRTQMTLRIKARGAAEAAVDRTAGERGGLGTLGMTNNDFATVVRFSPGSNRERARRWKPQ
jgi:hypothetical protein